MHAPGARVRGQREPGKSQALFPISREGRATSGKPSKTVTKASSRDSEDPTHEFSSRVCHLTARPGTPSPLRLIREPHPGPPSRGLPSPEVT